MVKIFIDCSSPILQLTLEQELIEIISGRDEANIIITDYLSCGNCLKIGEDLKPPLSKEYIKSCIYGSEEKEEEISSQIKLNSNDDKLRAILENITSKYINEIIEETKKFYENEKN
jgi:hypothetical protein